MARFRLIHIRKILGGLIILVLAIFIGSKVKADELYKIALLPSDSYYNNQWYLPKIKAPIAWEEQRESPDIVIAIIDSGVQIDHPDLKDNIWINNREIPNNQK
ncbi:hypothetical protein KBI31_00550, partial [Patescibacteria group bacterium]|nr:hypothetical protein [Patescibacteria group bacterium]